MSVAVVFGVSGISGFGMANALLKPSYSKTVKRVIALTKQPLSIEDSGLPKDPRLSIAAGIDLLQSVEDVAAALKAHVPGIEEATDIFYTAFNTSNTDNQLVMKDDNTKMLSTAVKAMEQVAPNLAFIALQTGSNHYGILFADVLGPKFGPVPLKEDLPRLPPPLSDSLMFYAMADEIKDLSADKSWKWCDIRPDMIVGHPPRPNSHSIAESVGAYLALYAHLKPLSEVTFPGTPESWKATFRFTGQDLLGDFAVRLSEAKHSFSSGEAFNIAHDDVTSWSQLWPQLAEYWGLRGVGPDEASTRKGDTQDWVISNIQSVRAWEEKYGLQPNRLLRIPWRYFEWALNMRTSREMDLTKSATIGYDTESTHLYSFKVAWERLQMAKYLPSPELLNGDGAAKH